LAEYAAADAALRLEVAKQYPDVQLTPGYVFEEGFARYTLNTALQPLALSRRTSGPPNCDASTYFIRLVSCSERRSNWPSQACPSKRDWNKPAKAGRTLTKINAHSTATKKASGSPLGAIKKWKKRMLTITGASTATANGTKRLTNSSTAATS